MFPSRTIVYFCYEDQTQCPHSNPLGLSLTGPTLMRPPRLTHYRMASRCSTAKYRTAKARMPGRWSSATPARSTCAAAAWLTPEHPHTIHLYASCPKAPHLHAGSKEAHVKAGRGFAGADLVRKPHNGLAAEGYSLALEDPCKGNKAFATPTQ